MLYERALDEIDDLKMGNQLLLYDQDINQAKLPEMNLSRTLLIASDRYEWRLTLDEFACSRRTALAGCDYSAWHHCARLSNRNLGNA